MTLVSPDYVRLRLIEAAQTLRRLPMDRRGRPAGMKTYWPDVAIEKSDKDVAYGWYGDPGWTAPDRSMVIAQSELPTPRPSSPSPAAIQRMDEAINWLWHVEPETWPLLWFKAVFPRHGLGRLADRMGASGRTLNRRWNAALADIAAALSDGLEKKYLDAVQPVQVFSQLSDRLAYCAPHPAPDSGRGIFAAGSPVSPSRNRFG